MSQIIQEKCKCLTTFKMKQLRFVTHVYLLRNHFMSVARRRIRLDSLLNIPGGRHTIPLNSVQCYDCVLKWARMEITDIVSLWDRMSALSL